MSAQLSLAIDTAAAPRRMPSEPIVREALIVGPYRYLLRRAWGSGPCILWCGLNPSIADGRRDDPTMLREIGFSYRWGFGSLVKVNIYPFISSSPAEMREWRATWQRQQTPRLYQKGSGLDAWLRNIEHVSRELANCQQYVAAWGNGADPMDLEAFLGSVRRTVDSEEHGAVDVPVTWHCLGTTLDGSPKHTLARGKHRVPDDAELTIWRKADI